VFFSFFVSFVSSSSGPESAEDKKKHLK